MGGELYKSFRDKGYVGVKSVIDLKNSPYHRDVVDFLKRLDDFEKRSRKVVLEAKAF